MLGWTGAKAIVDNIDSASAQWYRDRGLTPTISNQPKGPLPPMSQTQRDAAGALILPPELRADATTSGPASVPGGVLSIPGVTAAPSAMTRGDSGAAAIVSSALANAGTTALSPGSWQQIDAIASQFGLNDDLRFP